MAFAPTHYIVELLAPWGDVQLKRMFGGMGAYRDKLIFAIIDDGIVYFKVDDTTRGDYEAAQSEPFLLSPCRQGWKSRPYDDEWLLARSRRDTGRAK